MPEVTKVTEDMMSNWVGNNGDSEKREAWMLETLTEIANGEYDPEKLKTEVTEYND